MAHPAVVRKPPVSRGLSGYSTQDLYTELITRLGEDPNREGLVKTPERTEQAMSFLTKGYQEDADKILRGALFEVDYDEMVIVRDIEVFSLCEHHMLPFFGKVHVAYIPNGKVIGLSKIPRLVEVFARRLQNVQRGYLFLGRSLGLIATKRLLGALHFVARLGDIFGQLLC